MSQSSSNFFLSYNLKFLVHICNLSMETPSLYVPVALICLSADGPGLRESGPRMQQVIDRDAEIYRYFS